jgi:hypothetical protein
MYGTHRDLGKGGDSSGIDLKILVFEVVVVVVVVVVIYVRETSRRVWGRAKLRI